MTGRPLRQAEIIAVGSELLGWSRLDTNSLFLAERLAQRQMKMVREGTSVLELKNVHHANASWGGGGGAGLRDSMSPYLLVSVPPPAPMPPYQPVGGTLARVCRHPKSQLYLTGVGLMLMACGLVLGFSRGK